MNICCFGIFCCMNKTRCRVWIFVTTGCSTPGFVLHYSERSCPLSWWYSLIHFLSSSLFLLASILPSIRFQYGYDPTERINSCRVFADSLWARARGLMPADHVWQLLPSMTFLGFLLCLLCSELLLDVSNSEDRPGGAVVKNPLQTGQPRVWSLVWGNTQRGLQLSVPQITYYSFLEAMLGTKKPLHELAVPYYSSRSSEVFSMAK